MKKSNLPYILGVAFVMRLLAINQSLWLDEATSANVVQSFGFSGIVTQFSLNDFHPPLYYLFLKAWSLIFGISTISLRLPSVIFGIGTIYLTYLVGKQMKKELTGDLAAFLLAIAPLHIYYSQEVRMYSMAAFFVSLSVYYFLKTINKKNNLAWVGLAGSLSLIFFTDYLSILILPVFWAYSIVIRRKIKVKGWWRNFVLSHVPLTVSILCGLKLLFYQLKGGLGVQESIPGWWNTLGTLTVKNLALVPIKFSIGRVAFENNILYGLVLLFVFGLYGFIFISAFKGIRTKKKLNVDIGMFWLIVPVLAGVAISVFVPVLGYFRFLFVLPAFYLVLAAGMLDLKEDIFLPTFLFVFLVNFLFSGMYLTNQRFHREDWRGLVDYIEKSEGPESRQTIFVANSQMEGYRYYSHDNSYGGPGTFDNSYKNVWLMRYLQDVLDPEDNVRKKIEESGYNKIEEKYFNGVWVWKYEKPDEESAQGEGEL